MLQHAMDISGKIDTRLGEAIVVTSLAPPRADAVFLSINALGTPGLLNKFVLESLDLGPADLPEAKDLKDGYFITSVGRVILCYVVTVGAGATAQLLFNNLEKCLYDSRLTSLGSAWIPLMGTGSGQLSLVDSFRITLRALNECQWNERPGLTITISTPGPETGGFEDLAMAIQELVPSSLLPSETPIHPDSHSPSLAAEAILSVAYTLGLSRNEPALTTELLLFAFADATQTDAFDRLGRDRAAGAFASAIHELADTRYEPAWKKLFGRDWSVPKKVEGGRFSRTTQNAAAVLTRAATRAKQFNRAQFTVDDLVRSLLEGEGLYAIYLKEMDIRPTALIEAYDDILNGQVLMNLLNDATETNDRLGYSAYANAIAAFLRNTNTPAPLSISIQAPWGIGKSSLMQMIRERLDPESPRNVNRPKIGRTVASRLSLGDVLRFLDRKQEIGPDFWREPQEETPSARQNASPAVAARSELITIWFNAWKYESSEQVWAGLVDAIVSQIGDRLPLVQREAFLLRLHLARIDDGIVRRKIYDRVLTIWFAQVRRWVVLGLGATVAFLGFGRAEAAFPDLHPVIARLSNIGNAGSIASLVVLAVYLVSRYWMTRQQTHAEPAKFSLAPYLTVPDYSQTIGAIHQIHADLRRVLAAAPKEEPDKFSPIVIFIDDLDRCSPTKIAGVVEGVSMLLASETYRCIFIIGIDPQMIAAALEKAHEEIRSRLPSYERGVPLGWRFMDKFVQLPFTIPPQADLTEYLISLGASKTSAVAGPTAQSDTGQTGSDGRAQTGDATSFVGGDASAPGGDQSKPDGKQPSPDDSKDIGRIIRVLGQYSAGNPREIKRMVNLARLYLALRNERRRLSPFWRAPSLDHYARWIALTLRWPDMMRWLQWGADQTVWSTADNKQSLVVRRLKVLELAAVECPSVDVWKVRIEEKLHLDANDTLDWRKDSKLFEFFQSCAQLAPGRRLSVAVETGLW